MEDKSSSILYYLPVTPRDEAWGICCTTAGHQRVTSGTSYPVSRHPERYSFIKNRGRILKEYQLVYITAGAGSFESASCPETAVKAGTMLLLFPSEWHSYAPDPHTGWTEWWVGFRGGQIDRLAENGFLNPSHPVYAIGTSAGIESCYREIIAAVEQERAGFQVLVSSIVLHCCWTPSTGPKPCCGPIRSAAFRPNRSPRNWGWATPGSGAHSESTSGWLLRSTARPCG